MSDNVKPFDSCAKWVIAKPRSLKYKPQEDITVKEIADILPFFSFAGAQDFLGALSFYDSLNDAAKRHFVESSANPAPEAST